MTKLRQAMIEAMQVRGFSTRTHRSYLDAVGGLANYYERSPAQISTEEIQRYFLYLVKERHLSPASCRLALNGIVFLYKQVLERAFEAKIHIPKRPQRIPELLTRKEVAAILDACLNRKHRMLLCVCYGCGLRVSELLHLQVRDIDGERLLLRIDQGKGAKDRLVEMPQTLLGQLAAVSPCCMAVSGPRSNRGLRGKQRPEVFQNSEKPSRCGQGGWYPQSTPRLCDPSTGRRHADS